MLTTLHKFFFGTLRRRLIFSVAALQAVLMLVFIADLARRHSSLLRQRQREQVAASVNTLAGTSSGLMASKDIIGLQELVEALRLTSGIQYAMFLDEDGHILAHTDPLRVGQYLRDLPPLAQKEQVLQKGTVLEGFAPVMVANHHLGWIYLSMDQREAQGRLAAITRDGVLYSLVAILVGSLLAWLLGSRVVRRLSVLQSAIHKVKEGGAHVRSTLTGTDEVAGLSVDFNQMLDQLDQRDAELKQSEESYRRQFTENTSIMLMIDPSQGRILEANTAAVTFYGYSREQLLALSIADINTLPPARVQAALDSVGANQSERFVFQHRLADGSVRDVEVSASKIHLGTRPVLHSIVHDITARRQAEEALRESKQRLEFALQGGELGTWDYYPKTGTVLYGHLWAKMLEYQPDEVESTMAFFTEHIHPDDIENVFARIAKHVDGLAPSYQSEHRLRAKSGRWVWVADQGKIVERDPAGQPLRIAGIITDISRRKQAEKTLRESEALLTQSQAMAHVGSWVLDLATNRLTWSDEVYRIFGETPQTNPTTYEAFLQSVHPEDRAAVNAAYADSLQQGKDSFEIEHRVIRKDTAEIRFVYEKCLHVRNESGGVAKSIGMVQDITDRKFAEKKLEGMTNRFILASRAGGVGVWDWDVVSNQLIWDDQMYHLYGITADRFSGAYEAWQAGLHPEDRARGDADIQLALSGEKAFDSAFRVVRPDGGIRFIRALANVQWDASGQPLRMIGTNWDITENKQREAYSKNEQEALEVLARGGPLNDVLEGLLAVIEPLFPGVTGSVLLLDKDGRHLRHGAAPRLPLAYCQAIDGVEIGLNVGSCGTAAYTKQTIMVSDIASDPRWHDYKDLALAHGLKSCWSAPIVGTAGQVLGTLAFYFDTPRVALPSELEHIERGAHLVALRSSARRPRKKRPNSKPSSSNPRKWKAWAPWPAA